MKEDKVQLFRYVRPVKLNLDTIELVTEPTGGLTFLFEINQIEEKLKYIAVVCRDDENFDFEISKKIANGRFVKSYVHEIPYNRDLSLVENVEQFLDIRLSNISFTFDLIELAQLQVDITVKQKLKAILTQNRIQKEKRDNIVTQVTSKHQEIVQEYLTPIVPD
jgi:hypothetical protein